jgi:hypothetical protein
MQFNLDSDKTATRVVKNGLEIAVHDAALAVSPSDLSQGRIIFDQNTAIDNLKKSLESNLRLTSGAGYVYSPDSDSFFKKDLYIVDLEFIDDSVTTSYPYTYTNPNYDIIEQVNGPSVIAVMTTESPRWFIGNSITIRQAAVYEYKK